MYAVINTEAFAEENSLSDDGSRVTMDVVAGPFEDYVEAEMQATSERRTVIEVNGDA